MAKKWPEIVLKQTVATTRLGESVFISHIFDSWQQQTSCLGSSLVCLILGDLVDGLWTKDGKFQIQIPNLNIKAYIFVGIMVD